ncbi:DUF551 domain-containing protein [Actinobacillus pleuropneumoniae]
MEVMMNNSKQHNLKKLIPFDADLAIRHRLKCQLRNGDTAYCLYQATNPLVESDSIIGVHFFDDGTETPIHWGANGQWNRISSDGEMLEYRYDIIGMFPGEINNHDWIQVKEQLPTEQGYYLGYSPYWENPYEILQYDEDLGGFLDYQDEITHWQPLTKPPQD